MRQRWTYGGRGGRVLAAVGGFASSLTYHPNGAVSTVFHANGIHDVHWMDGSSMQRPARIRARRSGTFPWDPSAYQFDGAGNVMSIGHDPNDPTFLFTYDGGNRLVQSQADDGSEVVTQTYGYDGFGNLVSVTGPQGVRTFPADLATNRLAAAAYDAAGNLTSWGGFSYQWRPTGELRTRTGTGLNKWFAYDAGGERVVVHDRLSGRMTFTIRDLGGKVLRVFGKDAGGSWSWEKDSVYRDGLLLAAKDPAGTVHFKCQWTPTFTSLGDTKCYEVSLVDDGPREGGGGPSGSGPPADRRSPGGRPEGWWRATARAADGGGSRRIRRSLQEPLDVAQPV